MLRLNPRWCAPFAIVCLSGCTDAIPDGPGRTPAGSGASVRYDVYHHPLPDIPLPNDTATYADPTSRTGVRVNASVVAPTHIESVIRKKFDALEGWGTFAPIAVSFDKVRPDDTRAALDLQNIAARHQKDDFDFENDAVYVINLKTGLPAPLDLGEGSFQYVVKRKDRYWANDTRRWEQNLLWETYDETIDPVTGLFDPARTTTGTPDGVPVYQPQWDTDFDGRIDRPNLLNQTRCSSTAEMLLARAGAADGDAQARIDAARDRCITDELLTWYERETDSLIMRPEVPLDEQTTYAVVITDRVLDADGKPVRSPFDFVYHPSQREGAERLSEILDDPRRAAYFGDLSGTGLSHVAFAWTYTTEPIVEDLRMLRDGLYGHGLFAQLSRDFPAHFDVTRSAGMVDAEGVDKPGWQSDPKCATAQEKPYVMTTPEFKPIGGALATGLGFSGPTGTDLIDTFDHVAHVVTGTFQSPWFIEGGPGGLDPNASFTLDFSTGEGRIDADTVQFLIAIPKETPEHQQPFPVAYYGHGYTGGSIEMLGFAGRMAQQGIASVIINAVSHGIVVDDTTKGLGTGLFNNVCRGSAAPTFFGGRYHDWNGDGVPDSGGDYWTAYLFHTRDVVRQSAIDLLQFFRIMKTFDGRTLAGLDFNGNGDAGDDLAGDFDGDGRPDLGGPTVPFYSWGQSLGGILSPFAGALDPQVAAAAPNAGAGGLLDVGARTQNGGAFEGIYLRMFGPLVVAQPKASLRADRTACADGELSLRFVALNVNETGETEFECLDPATIPNGGTAFVRNRSNGEVRCGRIEPDGQMRVAIPTTEGDQLEVDIYDTRDAVDSYDQDTGCHPTLGVEHRVKLISSWGKGLVAASTPDPIDPSIGCLGGVSCSKFQNHYYPQGSPLVAVTDGLGLIRQTPSLRRLLNLATSIIDPGDPANFAPYYALKQLPDAEGNPKPPTAILNIDEIGDQDVPCSAGVAMGRAAGTVPFLRPDAADKYPELADYVTPQELYAALGNHTPNRVLIDSHALEGIDRLQRYEATACGLNQAAPGPDVPAACHKTCSDDSGCLDDQVCSAGACTARTPSAAECSRWLADVDDVDDGAATWGEARPFAPLRVARRARPATVATLADVWAPRIRGVPGAADANGWQPDGPLLAQLLAYVLPDGNHGIEPNDPCQQWQVGRYYTNLVGRFFATNGADLYYITHPSTHSCLGLAPGAGGCDFVMDNR